MSVLLKSDPVPLQVDEEGVIRVGGTRVSLDTVVSAFNSGSTAEQIAQDYSSLRLADIYAVIAYYLHHHAEVETYLARQEREAAEIRKQLEAQFDPQGIRTRLIARRAAGDDKNASAGRG